MKTRTSWAALLLAATAAAGPEAPGPAEARAVRSESAAAAPHAWDKGWKALFARLAVTQPTYATFTETRTFAFRKKPTVLLGEVRIDPRRGLSLRYTKPEEQLLIVDGKGLLQRDARGRSRPVPSDASIAAMGRALAPMFTFDLETLTSDFLIAAERRPDGWQLELTPRSTAVARALGRVLLVGSGDRLERIEFTRGERNRVTIAIGEPIRRDAFTAEETQRFFR